MHGGQALSNADFDHTSGADYVTGPAAELFGNFSVQDLVHGDLLGLELGVSDFDATGLI